MTGKNPTSVEVDEYIAGFPPEVKAKLQTMRELIREIAPQAEEKISYKMPTYALHGNLVHFAGYAKHIGFYPAPSGIEEFKQELSAYKGAKGSVQFPLDQPLPEALIRRIVAFRVKENEEKARQKKQGK
ncbi:MULTISPECIES: DUF1801 domain-containing protein [unclassified Paenibacillus]|uniref:iron chaperone n=1 Tax=unclassified Paenibacillus TaxID=185978 RepID=UPI001F1F1B23|nr:DUF1801 domain-containing protein [Paenibacillus sp. JJ-223]CAH1222078.1 hypothetical protein PAECIP111890_05345 [Paenibacillus sp. JJ-223]